MLQRKDATLSKVYFASQWFRFSVQRLRAMEAIALLPGTMQNRHHTLMERQQVIQEIRERVNQISSHVTALHPLVPKLEDPPTQAELFKALFELTKQVEVMKKHLLKLEQRDDSTAL